MIDDGLAEFMFFVMREQRLLNVRGVLTIVCSAILGVPSASSAFQPMSPLGCCAVSRAENPVVNADQTVIILWDKERQTQHFIRKADFKTDASDIGFLVPSPSRPQLSESGNAAFALLDRITMPPPQSGGGFPLGCAAQAPTNSLAYGVRVVEEKRVAGFDATVLTARSGEDLVQWLKKNGYAYSPAVAEWAKPYLGGTWHFTALKVAKDQATATQNTVKAAALRISFRTDQPLFPYREPESSESSQQLGAKKRLLRIYFIAETQYVGKIDGKKRWSGKALWSGDITTHRNELLSALQLPSSSGPSRWWLTKIDDQWPYEKAAGDVYFSPATREKSFNLSAASTSKTIELSGLTLVALFSWTLLRKRSQRINLTC
jgi:hypothetical protein